MLARSKPQLRAMLEKELASRTMRHFVAATTPNYEMGWVHRLICDKLDEFLAACAAGESPRLQITMPPRHGKSELVSRKFPAYVLGRYPDSQIISASYSADLSTRMSRDVQRGIGASVYQDIFPNTRLPNLRENFSRTSDLFEIPGYSGGYRSTGVGGGITGMGANIIVLDDVFKDRDSADSENQREKVWDWYTSTLYTRLAPGGGIVLINTRWHMDDLSGRLLEAQANGTGDEWEILNFPAIATHEEEFRHEGEALHPERYPLSKLLQIKQVLGSRDWESLYQQHPVPAGGALFKKEWLRYWTRDTLPERFDQTLMSWDLSFKNTNTSDYIAGQAWGRKGANFYLLDQIHCRASFTETCDQVVTLAERHPTILKKLVEDTANGPAVMDALRARVVGLVPVKPDGSKTARAHAVTPFFEGGNVFIPDKSVFPWVKDYEAELLQFPLGAHDDMVDATTQALRSFITRKGLNMALTSPPRLF